VEESQLTFVRLVFPGGNVNLRYKITPIDSIRYQVALAHGSRHYLRQRKAYNYARGLWFVLWAYALATSIVFVHSIPMTLVVAGLLVFQLRHFLPFDAHLQRLFLERYGSAPVKELQLRIDHSGLTESEGDVVFFAPWTSIELAALRGDLLLIRVQSGQHIVISRHSLEPADSSLESVLAAISAQVTPGKAEDAAS
jgi:hypothetical protein